MGINELIKIGNNLKKLRKSKNFTQLQMANELGISVSAYSNYENDNRTPSLDTIYRICSILDVGLVELLDDYTMIFMNSQEVIDEINCTNEKYKKDHPEEYKKREEDINGKRLNNLIKRKTDILNNDGKQKVIDYIDDLDPKYKKK